MAYPPTVPPATRTDATVMATNHPSDHNLTSTALTEILNHIATMENALYPIGVISSWGGDVAPGNHALCQGQAVSRSANPEVFSLVGTKFGAGDGSTTFNMPDLRGRYPIGYNVGGSYMSAGIGEKFGSATAPLPSHQHLGADHAHPVSITSGDDDTNHIHFPDSGAQFVMSGAGSGGSAGIGPGTGYSLGMPAGRSAFHRHLVSGSTGLMDRSSATSFQGVDPTNGNLPPSLSLNFVMRMH